MPRFGIAQRAVAAATKGAGATDYEMLVSPCNVSDGGHLSAGMDVTSFTACRDKCNAHREIPPAYYILYSPL